jgi:SAM-dependent methyltransferase
MPDSIAPSEGSCAFGEDPYRYDRARPPYPKRIFERLMATGNIYAGSTALDIGAGMGVAARCLAELGASHVTVVEPDHRFLPMLERLAIPKTAALQLIAQTFESATLPLAFFDLAVSATAFHWIDRAVGLAKVGQVLRRGGTWAMWWNVFGDPDRPDAFHDVTSSLLSSLPRSPSHAGKGNTSFALDTDARVDDIVRTGVFTQPDVELMRWSIHLNPAQVRDLYATFSPLQKLPTEERGRLLDQLADIAVRQFDGVVERPMVTALYVATRI